MTVGLPIFCSNVEPMPDFKEEAGVLVDIDDEAVFLYRVQSLMVNIEERDQVSQNAQTNAEKYQLTKTEN